MKTSQIAEAVNGEWLVNCEEKEIYVAFASDLMSDVLAMVQENPEETLLITGLCNAQSIRTADMLDIRNILVVRNKKYNEEEIELAKECGINVIATPYTMFETCALLHDAGLKSV